MIDVKILETGEVRKVNESYASRLIEQGRAIPAPAASTEKKAERKNADGAK